MQNFAVIGRGQLSVPVKQLTVAQPNSKCFYTCDFIAGLVGSAMFQKVPQIERVQEFVEQSEFARNRIFPGESHSTPL